MYINNVIVFLLTLKMFFYLNYIYAQMSALEVIEKANLGIASIDKGEYRVKFRFKSFFDTDTLVASGKVQYFKDQEEPGDSVARFILWTSENSPQGYDGLVYWEINDEEKKIIIINVKNNKGIHDYISKYNLKRQNFLALPILKNRGYQPFLLNDFKDWSVSRISLNDTLFIALEKRDFVPNKQKLTPTDTDSILIEEKWLFYPKIFHPRIHSLRVDRQNGLVYFNEISYTPIQSLPDTVELESLFNINMLLKQGYQIEEKTISNKKNKQTLAVGDTFPNFEVRLESGDTFLLLSAFKQRYVVIDFWYRACAPCNLAMPALERLARSLSENDIAIVAVNPIDKQYSRLIDQYKKQYGYTFNIAFCDRAIVEKLKIWSYPTLFVVDTEIRKIIHLYVGYSESSFMGIQSYLEGLLK